MHKIYNTKQIFPALTSEHCGLWWTFIFMFFFHVFKTKSKIIKKETMMAQMLGKKPFSATSRFYLEPSLKLNYGVPICFKPFSFLYGI